MDTNKKMPLHVSLIMDGNGRWAQNKGLPRVRGHVEGVESVRTCLETAIKEGIKYLSLFAFSEENWARPDNEVSSLMKLMMQSMKEEFEAFVENDIRFVVVGNRERLGGELNEAIDRFMKKTEKNNKITLIVFLSYSGKWDILQAAKKMAMEAYKHPERIDSIMDMNEDGFDNYLATAGIPDPDLIIRTSGERRISNYLLWQGAYSELLSVDTLWPDFREEEFKNAIKEYFKRDRRYGKVK